MRKLASIQRIEALRPIPGADKIEVATVLGWEVVVSKADGFKVGDMCVYVETDSILPEAEWSEFMRERKFRVKTIKLRKQVSQGIVFPLDILGATEVQLGDDVTEILDIKIFVFNIFDITHQRYLIGQEFTDALKILELEPVPQLFTGVFYSDLSVAELVNMSNGKSRINPETKREGIVIRMVREIKTIYNTFNLTSFKVISPEFCLEYGL